MIRFDLLEQECSIKNHHTKNYILRFHCIFVRCPYIVTSGGAAFYNCSITSRKNKKNMLGPAKATFFRPSTGLEGDEVRRWGNSGEGRCHPFGRRLCDLCDIIRGQLTEYLTNKWGKRWDLGLLQLLSKRSWSPSFYCHSTGLQFCCCWLLCSST